MIDNSTKIPESRSKAYFVRLPEDMYKEIERHAKENGRTIQMQTHIIIGAALNKGLVNPTGVTITTTVE